MTAINSTQAVQLAKLYLVSDHALSDGIVSGTIDGSGNGSLTGRSDSVVAGTIVPNFGPLAGQTVPVWKVSFPEFTPEPGGEPHLRVAVDDAIYAAQASAFTQQNPNRAALHPSNTTILDAFYTQ